MESTIKFCIYNSDRTIFNIINFYCTHIKLILIKTIIKLFKKGTYSMKNLLSNYSESHTYIRLLF